MQRVDEELVFQPFILNGYVHTALLFIILVKTLKKTALSQSSRLASRAQPWCSTKM